MNNFYNTLKSVAVRNAQPRHFTIGMPFQWRQFQRIIWTNLSHDEWAQINQTIKAAIEKSILYTTGFHIFNLGLDIIASQQKRTVIDEAGKWLIDLCKNFKITALLSLNTNDPFFANVDYIWYNRQHPICKNSSSITFSAQNITFSLTNMLSWIQDEIPDQKMEINRCCGSVLAFT